MWIQYKQTEKQSWRKLLQNPSQFRAVSITKRAETLAKGFAK